jgi:hypothetical protein
MTSDRILKDWDETNSSLWGQTPIQIAHNLHNSQLFSRDALAALIEAYPREHYNLIQTASRESRRVWREGEVGNLNGHQIIDAIGAGTLWLNLRKVTDVDARYRVIVNELFDEIRGHVPNFGTPEHTAGMLISSPKAQVYYHSDLPGQGLIQLVGTKRVYVYPSKPPFVAAHHLEDIALFGVEVDMPYADWYDRHATIYDLAPGQMLHWPLNAPHRVENLDTVNISMTISYTDEQIRRLQMVNFTNGLLRHKFGYQAKSRSTTGPSFFAKRVLQRTLRNSSWIRRERTNRQSVDFKLDDAKLGAIVDIPRAAIAS